MAKNTQLATAPQNAMTDALTAKYTSGSRRRIYNGSQPANANTAVSTQTLLAELTFNTTAYGASASGTATANAITSDTDADASGTASWFRDVDGSGATIRDGTVGAIGSTSNLELSTVTITIHDNPIAITADTVGIPAAGS